jgi:HD-GYP domain-containing protein (c-di-GMP phosphodiesterase class II)
MGCTLHDIGKIGVPDAILNKADRLTDEERKCMMEHPQVGLKIIRDIDLFNRCKPYIIAHHERYDGDGYPNGLQGDEIPVEGRLLAVVDTFDAIMSDRPYRKGAALTVAISELVENAGKQFDPSLVKTFIGVLKAGEIDLLEMYGREVDLGCLDEIDLAAMEKRSVPV